MDQINYHCPDFFFGIEIYDLLLNLQESYPQMFLEKVKISKIFGSFPGMIWAGGTYMPGFVPQPKVQEIVNFFYQKRIPLKLTLTNGLLTETDCYDRYCNMILRECHNDLNEILVVSDILEDYIKQNYPLYKINRSIIATEVDVNYNEYCEKYNTVVLPRRKVKDFDFLKTIDVNKRNQIEFLCNDPCPLDCPRLYTHYKDFSKMTLFEEQPDSAKICCSVFTTPEDVILQRAMLPEEKISYTEIIDNYLPLGFTEFKISGRGRQSKIIFALMPYLIKPEYQLWVAQYLVEKCNHMTRSNISLN